MRRRRLKDPGDLTGFPSTRAPESLHRVCRACNATWWFSSDGSGRFDLTPPEGTCYLATDEAGAIREASRLGPVTPAWLAAREIRTVRVPARLRLAATTWQAALFGVAGERSGRNGTRKRLTADTAEAAGVRVLAPPHSAVLRVEK